MKSRTQRRPAFSEIGPRARQNRLLPINATKAAQPLTETRDLFEKAPAEIWRRAKVRRAPAPTNLMGATKPRVFQRLQATPHRRPRQPRGLPQPAMPQDSLEKYERCSSLLARIGEPKRAVPTACDQGLLDDSAGARLGSMSAACWTACFANPQQLAGFDPVGAVSTLRPGSCPSIRRPFRTSGGKAPCGPIASGPRPEAALASIAE